MPAFKRLDHLLCDVPDIEGAFRLFTEELRFPVAWPIGRYWPQGRTCGVALGGANLEFIQPDESPPLEARIETLAFEPTRELHSTLDAHGTPYEVFEKRESDAKLLRLRSLPDDQGEQLLCVNTSPSEPMEFDLFACRYTPLLQEKLSPKNLRPSDGNELQEVVLGHPFPDALERQLAKLGVEGGVRIRVQVHPVKEVVALRMKNGPLELPGFPSRFRFL